MYQHQLGCFHHMIQEQILLHSDALVTELLTCVTAQLDVFTFTLIHKPLKSRNKKVHCTEILLCLNKELRLDYRAWCVPSDCELVDLKLFD